MTSLDVFPLPTSYFKWLQTQCVPGVPGFVYVNYPGWIKNLSWDLDWASLALPFR